MEQNKDIKNFDALEKEAFSTVDQSEHDLFKSISSLDNLMRAHDREEVSKNFTEALLKDVLKINKRFSGNRVIKLLAFIFMPIIIISMLVIYLNTGTIENPQVVTELLEKFYTSLQFTNDPKVKQLFLIGEGIILLVIVEKIASSYRIIRHSANG